MCADRGTFSRRCNNENERYSVLNHQLICKLIRLVITRLLFLNFGVYDKLIPLPVGVMSTPLIRFLYSVL